MDSTPENRWLRYGLSTNPYFVEALSSVDEGPRPIRLFRGRSDKVKSLLDTVASEQNSLCVVEGASGVGKSTFANFVKYRLSDTYVALPNEVNVQTTTTPQGVLLAILDEAVRHASDLAPETDWEEEAPHLHQARQFIMAYEGGGWSVGLSGGLPGGPQPGVSVGKDTAAQAPAYPPVLSRRFFDGLVQDMLQLTSPPADGLVIHVNNLDVLLNEGTEATKRLFSDLREYFQIPGTHWLFLGPPGLEASAIAPERRLQPFVKARISLENLPVGDVLDILHARYEHYAVERGDWTPPTKAELVEQLYDKFGGDLRGALGALTAAHKSYRPVDVAPMPEGAGLEHLQDHFSSHLADKLRPKTLEILEHLIEAGETEFTQDAAEPVEKHQSNRSLRFQELEQWDAIRLVRTEGVRKFYTFGGAARLAYGL